MLPYPEVDPGELSGVCMFEHIIQRGHSSMAFNRNHARPLCSDAEYKLFTASLGDEIGDLTPAQLRSKIQRARRLRDKYRDLLKRQRLANRARTGTKKGARPDTNVRTADKAKLFDEALARFQARADKLTAAAEREARRKAAKTSLKDQVAAKERAGERRAAALAEVKPRGRTATGATGYASESAHGSALDKLVRDTRAGARKGQKNAAGARSQARRDRRG
jgi:hypothetical protein